MQVSSIWSSHPSTLHAREALFDYGVLPRNETRRRRPSSVEPEPLYNLSSTFTITSLHHEKTVGIYRFSVILRLTVNHKTIS